MTIKIFSTEYLSSLIEEATSSARARRHRNIHSSYEDPCQRFMNAIGINSYIRPHRHAMEPKSETLIAVLGKFALFIFDDEGTVQDIIRFGTEYYANEDQLSIGVDIPPGIWHTIVALEPRSILLELKAGPFDPSLAKEPALWAPEEESLDGALYLQRLQSLSNL